MEFATREDYLKWRAAWRARYKELAQAIRGMKVQRKQFVNIRMTREMVDRLPNPRYNVEAPYAIVPLRMEAAEMMAVRRECREQYNIKRLGFGEPVGGIDGAAG